MRILDENNVEILEENLDLNLGYLVEDKIFVTSHPAIEARKEVYHYETVKEFSNGGKEVKKVIDVPGIEAKEAWDEYEDIYRYVLYTEEELQDIRAEQERQARLDELARDGVTWTEMAKAYFEGVQEA